VTTRRIPKRVKWGLIILGVGGAITLGLFVDVIGRIQSMVREKEPEGNPFTTAPAPLYNQTDPPMPVKLFFPAAGDDVALGVEDGTIFRSAELANRARQIIQKLLDGPKSTMLFPSIPKDAKMQEVFIDEMGTAYVDFSSPLAANHLGGIMNEQATIYSIVNSLTYNLKEIRQVQILVGGAEKETLAGHLLLLPLEMDLSMTNVTPQEPSDHAN
jgi:hypothetical protein